MLATLPKLADRSFIIGFLLPSLLFALVLLLQFNDYAGAGPMLKGMLDEDVAGAVLFGIAVWVLGLVMMVLNLWLYRMLEGYLPPLGWFGKCRARHVAAHRKAREDAWALRERWSREGDAFPPADITRYTELMRRIARSPAEESDFLPTAFGNAIKAFETYPREVYGADGVPLRLHLGAVAPKEMMEQANLARAQVDFMVNACFFALAIGLGAVWRLFDDTGWGALVAALGARQLGNAGAALAWGQLVWIAGAALASWLFYRLAVLLVPAWGDMVKAIFDVALPDLAKKLGFALPIYEEGRREFWTSFSQMVTLRKDLDGQPIFRAGRWPKAGA